MRKSTNVKSNISIISSSADNSRRIASRYPFNIYKVSDDTIKLYDLLYNSLRIITIALNEENDDFFSEYSNLKKFLEIFNIYKIKIINFEINEELFKEKSIFYWVEVITLLIISLYSLPNNGGVKMEHIEYNTKATCFNLIVHTEHMDKKQHILSIMIKEDDTKSIALDNEVMLFN